MSSLSPRFTAIISFFELIQYLQIDPKNGRITVKLVQQHSSHHAYLHQSEQDGVKHWPKTATG